jgi:hypothetical protein
MLAAIVLTWPLVSQITHSIPLGSESASTVPLFNLWTLGWNVDRLQHGYEDYWDAPIFYPVPGAFAFSEPQPLSGLLAAPIWQRSPALAYNVVLLLFLALNGAAANHLLRQLHLSPGSAFLGGLLVMALPFLAYERGVLQLQPLFGVFWALAGLLRLVTRPDRLAAVSLGLGVGTTFLTSEHYALFLGLTLAIAAPFFAGPILRHARGRWLAMASIGLAASLLIPVALPQNSSLQAMGFARSAETVTNGSAEWLEYLQVPHQVLSHGWLSLPDEGGQHLFPGLMLLGLAATGIVVGLRSTSRRRWTLFLAIAAAIFFLLSLGLNSQLGIWSPYGLLREHVPGFADLRSPFRLAYFVQLYLALLAALALDALWSWRRRMTLVLFTLLLMEIWPLPARLTRIPEPIATSEIASPAIVLPYTQGRSAAAYADTAAWMVATLQEDPISLVNGYSGYFPRLNGQLRELLADFPTPAGLTTLRALGVRTVVIRPNWLDADQQTRLERAVATGDLSRIGKQQELLLYRLSDARLSPAQAYDGGWALEVEVARSTVTVAAYAAVQDNSMYVLVPGKGALTWSVQMSGEAGDEQTTVVAPTNAVLLYHGSDRWLRVAVPRPSGSGAYALLLRDADDGRILGETTIQLP